MGIWRLANQFIFIAQAIMHIWLALVFTWHWKRSIAGELFEFDDQDAERTAKLARYCALQSLLIALWLLWLVVGESIHHSTRVYSMLTLSIVGLAGGKFIDKKIGVLQGLPAFAALVLLWLNYI